MSWLICHGPGTRKRWRFTIPRNCVQNEPYFVVAIVFGCACTFIRYTLLYNFIFVRSLLSQFHLAQLPRCLSRTGSRLYFSLLAATSGCSRANRFAPGDLCSSHTQSFVNVANFVLRISKFTDYWRFCWSRNRNIMVASSTRIIVNLTLASRGLELIWNIFIHEYIE